MVINSPIMCLALNGIIKLDLIVNVYFMSTAIFFVGFIHYANYRNKIKLTYNSSPFNLVFLFFCILIIWMLQTLIFSPINFIFDGQQVSKWNNYYFGALILAPIFEEIIFRNVLLNSLLNKYDLRKSIIISSCLFGIVHWDFYQTIYATVFGLFFGVIYVKNKNIAYCIILHFCNNAFVILINLLVYKFSNTLLFNIGFILNVIISFLLLKYLNRKFDFSIQKLFKLVKY